ncbi:DNA topoisomerase family protein [Vibrio aphrogenes]|uniref:DNA topoisomerase family protein n=1 Tax=Vibrio aphrogenes TaxID=1891186 RepID=UPI000B355915|nr:type I DNA topoisomerase [Vibrio aphrogenes]
MNNKIDQTLFSAHEQALQHEACPKCGVEHHGELQLRHGKRGPFLGCHRYPQCDYIKPLHQNDGHIIKALGVACPECGETSQGELVLRQGRFGMFIGCSRFPECHHLESPTASPKQDNLTSVACPECASGHLIERQSRFGKSFYACDAYPKCKFSINLPPLEGQCEQCGYPLLVEKHLSSGRKVLCADRKCQHTQSGDAKESSLS